MHTPSTRILSALAYDRGEEFDPGLPPCSALVEALSLVDHATLVFGEEGSFERARRLRRERDRARGRERAEVPGWFSAQDLIAAPWEPDTSRFL